MRSRLIHSARCIARDSSGLTCSGLRRAGARWSSSTATSSTGRQWSTPLAKTLGEAITVGDTPATYGLQLILSTDHRSDPCSLVHAAMSGLGHGRLLHSRNAGSRSVRSEGRLCHLTRDISDLRRVGRAMGGCRMDGTGTKERGCISHGSRTGSRHTHGRHAENDTELQGL